MRQHPGTFTAGLIFTVIGLAYLLEAFDVWKVNLARAWPVALIAAGVVIILNARHDTAPPAADKPEEPAA